MRDFGSSAHAANAVNWIYNGNQLIEVDFDDGTSIIYDYDQNGRIIQVKEHPNQEGADVSLAAQTYRSTREALCVLLAHRKSRRTQMQAVPVAYPKDPFHAPGNRVSHSKKSILSAQRTLL
jgi:YD repeat-containing protein